MLAPFVRTVTVVVRSTRRAKRAYVERAANSANVKFIWDDSGWVVTDERMRTAGSSIFAIGARRSVFSGERTGAAEEAAIAAAAIANDLAH